jgi:multidrug efflux pump subunit AcrA (membrane-fusion protein)
MSYSLVQRKKIEKDIEYYQKLLNDAIKYIEENGENNKYNKANLDKIRRKFKTLEKNREEADTWCENKIMEGLNNMDTETRNNFIKNFQIKAEKKAEKEAKIKEKAELKQREKQKQADIKAELKQREKQKQKQTEAKEKAELEQREKQNQADIKAKTEAEIKEKAELEQRKKQEQADIKAKTEVETKAEKKAKAKIKAIETANRKKKQTEQIRAKLTGYIRRNGAFYKSVIDKNSDVYNLYVSETEDIIFR